MTGELSKNFHGVGIGPLSKILADKVLNQHELAIFRPTARPLVTDVIYGWSVSKYPDRFVHPNWSTKFPTPQYQLGFPSDQSSLIDKGRHAKISFFKHRGILPFIYYMKKQGERMNFFQKSIKGGGWVPYFRHLKVSY